MSKDNDRTEYRMQSAVQFLQLVVAGEIEKAYKEYVDFDGKHHNPYFPAGFQELQKAMMEDHAKFPKKQLIIKAVLGDNDLVAVHSHLIQSSGGMEISVVHLFRFQDNKIIEMWDVAQIIPTDSPNKDGIF